jgi:uncharacterized paraquat-inducible protein A
MLPVELRDKLAVKLFGWKFSEAYTQRLCINCHEKQNLELMETLDRQEYNQSALCPKCFTKIMGEKDE